MAAQNNRYKEMENFMTLALIVDAILFVLYMIFAGVGVIWLKVIFALVIFLLSGACLAFLYLSKELLHHRSLWMSVAAVCIIICLLFSIILNFPSPNPYA